MSIADIKAWMAAHVFLTIAIAVGLTLALIWLSSEVLRRFHLRLLQAASAALLAAGLWVLSMGIPSSTILMAAGAGIGLAACLTFYAGTRLDSIAGARIASLEADLKKAKGTQPLHFIVDPGQAKAAVQK